LNSDLLEEQQQRHITHDESVDAVTCAYRIKPLCQERSIKTLPEQNPMYFRQLVKINILSGVIALLCVFSCRPESDFG
jgi:hypothetical protein